MKGFKFRYESILNLIEKKEDDLKNKLSQAYNHLNKEKNKLNDLVNKDKECSQIILDMSSSGCKLSTLLNIEDYRRDLNNKIAIQNRIITMKDKEIQSIKNDLLETSKEKKIMEKLRERKIEDYNLKLRKIEERSIDQLVSYNNSLIHR